MMTNAQALHYLLMDGTLDALDAKIILRLVGWALDRDWSVDVWDGEEYAVKEACTRDTIIQALLSTDEDQLIFRANGKKVGWISLVYGNEPGVVISDHSDNQAIRDLVDGVLQSLGVDVEA